MGGSAILMGREGTIRCASCWWRASVSLLAALTVAFAMPRIGFAQSTLRVVAYNIKHGLGMDDEVDLERIADVLRELDADVITLQEVDDRTERTDRVDQVAVLAQLLGYQGFHGPHRPYQGGQYGNGILTRMPVRRVRTHSIPPASASDLTVQEVELVLAEPTADSAGYETEGTISVVSVHLAGTPEERIAQADSVTRLFGGTDHPVILAGDFNGRPDGPVLGRLRENWRVLEKSGDPATYPSPAPDREIDFVMVRPEASFEPIEHRVIDEPLASDHRPILAVVRVYRLGPSLPGGPGT